MEKLEINLENYKKYGNYFDITERKTLIAESLKALRELSGYTQSEIAKIIDIKSGAYSTYENGTREAPAEIIVRLALLYNVPTDYILQTSRIRLENYIAKEQFEDIDKEIEEIIEKAKDNENEDIKKLVNIFTDSMKNMTNELKKMNENNVPKGQDK